MEENKKTKDLYQEDNRHDWIVCITVPSGPTSNFHYEPYYSLTKEQLIELLCYRAIKQDSYLSTEGNSEYKHNDFISEKIRSKQIKQITFYKIANCEYGMQNEVYKQLPIIKEREVQAEKKYKEQAERRERLKLYQELKKEFEGKE